MKKLKTAVTHKGDGHRKRLRERFLKNGLDGFHDYEVIELLLSLNTPRKDCKQSAKLLLERFETLPAVMEAPADQLCQVNGVGPANILGVKLIKAVSDRYLEQRILAREVVTNSKALLDYLNQTIGHRNKEVFCAVLLDAKNRVLTSRILFEGSLTSSSVYPREVIIHALQHNAAAVIFAHNHPSGDLTPSAGDLAISRQLYFALRYVGITMHEHLIISSQGSCSLAGKGIIDTYKNEFEQKNVQ